MQLSIVTTLYKSETFIQEFYERIIKTVEGLTNSFEIIFVDDGSPDSSADIVKELINKDNRINLVELSRNFGHHPAAIAAISHSIGERVFLIDSDLEDPPELLKEFWLEFEKGEYDVVFGIQQIRKGSIFKKYSGSLFYKAFNLVSDTKIPENPCTIRLMSRNYVNALLTLGDKNLFLAGNFIWTGFDQKAFLVNKDVRREKSTYKPSKMLNLLINAVTSFSAFPLRLVFITGFILSLISGIFGTYILINKILNPGQVQIGYSSIMVSIWFLGGLIILFVGIVGIYLSKVFIEVKNRPLYLIKSIYNSDRMEDEFQKF